MTGLSVKSNWLAKLSGIFFIALALVLAACGGPTTTPTKTSTAKTTTLRFVASPNQTLNDLFNPYENTNAGSAVGTQGLLYETLYYVNQKTGGETPWLASSYQWSSDASSITFTIRDGVKWNDGQALTAADVKFTFDEMQTYKALDTTGVWAGGLKSVTATGNTVTFTATKPDSTMLYRLGGQIYIVPQHVWSTLGDPSKLPNDSSPVGTGPYTLQHYTANLLTYVANDSYWGTKPAVKTIEIPFIKDNTTAIAAMIKGDLDWMGTGWDPALDPAFTGKDPTHNITYFPASNSVMLYLNLTHAPFSDLQVRKAINAAINRDNLPQGIAKYAKVTNITGVLPSFTDWIKPAYQTQKFEYGVAAADAYLTADGYAPDSAGFYAKGGKEIKFQINVPSGWSDWDQDVQNMVTDLQAAHINASTNFQSGYTPYYAAMSTGTFDASISWTNSGPTPYYAYQAMLTSSYGTGATISGTNFEHWNSTTGGTYAAQIDADLQKYQGSSDKATQVAAIQDIEDVMVSQLPALPLTANVNWDEYTTSNWTGWPSDGNPYSYGAPFTAPDFESIILQLKPVLV